MQTLSLSQRAGDGRSWLRNTDLHKTPKGTVHLCTSVSVSSVVYTFLSMAWKTVETLLRWQEEAEQEWRRSPVGPLGRELGPGLTGPFTAPALFSGRHGEAGEQGPPDGRQAAFQGSKVLTVLEPHFPSQKDNLSLTKKSPRVPCRDMVCRARDSEPFHKLCFMTETDSERQVITSFHQHAN